MSVKTNQKIVLTRNRCRHHNTELKTLRYLFEENEQDEPKINNNHVNMR